MRSCRLFFLIGLIWAIPIVATAQVADSATVSGLPMGQMDSIGSMVVRLVLVLGAIVVVIFATVWVIKRLMARRWPGGTANRPIRVLDRIHLAPKRSLDVVAVGERVILLGVTETGINFLTELSPDERGQLQVPATKPAGFKSALNEAKDRMRHVFNQTHSRLPESASSAVAGAESQ